jgi:hypothetical protein
MNDPNTNSRNSSFPRSTTSCRQPATPRRGGHASCHVPTSPRATERSSTPADAHPRAAHSRPPLGEQQPPVARREPRSAPAQAAVHPARRHHAAPPVKGGSATVTPPSMQLGTAAVSPAPAARSSFRDASERRRVSASDARPGRLAGARHVARRSDRAVASRQTRNSATHPQRPQGLVARVLLRPQRSSAGTRGSARSPSGGVAPSGGRGREAHALVHSRSDGERRNDARRHLRPA